MANRLDRRRQTWRAHWLNEPGRRIGVDARIPSGLGEVSFPVIEPNISEQSQSALRQLEVFTNGGGPYKPRPRGEALIKFAARARLLQEAGPEGAGDKHGQEHGGRGPLFLAP